MKYSGSIRELIKQRRSIRAYDKSRKPESRLIEELNKEASALKKGLWGESAEFTVFAAHSLEAGAVRIGTYGLIVHPHAFMIGKIQKGPYCYESYGYLFEQLILKATDLGLDTCWLGYFRDRIFKNKFSVHPHEIIPAISALGYRKEKGFNRDHIIKLINFTKRRAFTELFFETDFNTPLTEQRAGTFRDLLEMVRRAPSARNLQPWRIVKAGQYFHFFLDSSRSNKGYDERKFQYVDMGIAMCHFELTARELKINGKWEKRKQSPLPILQKMRYIVSFALLEY